MATGQPSITGGIDLPVHCREIADISGVAEQDSVYGFQGALTSFEDCFIGEKVTYTDFSYNSTRQ